MTFTDKVTLGRFTPNLGEVHPRTGLDLALFFYFVCWAFFDFVYMGFLIFVLFLFKVI